MWKIQIRKAVISLPIYLAVSVSFLFCMNLIFLMLDGKWFSGTTYIQAIALTLGLWMVRQFVRFWVTLYRTSRY